MSKPTQTSYLVTGATGNIGSLVVERLLQRGVRPRIFARDPEKARARFGHGVEIAVGDLADAGTLAPALADIEALFLVNSGPGLDRQDAGAAAVARAAGVRRLVKLSSLDAQDGVGTGAWHARGEAAIRESGVPFTFVRPTGFMANVLYWARSIKQEGVVRAATGEGRIPFIHSEDIADVAVKALTGPEHEGATLPITGPEALSYGEMTQKLAAALGRPLRFQPISDEEARRQQVAWGAPPAMVDARLSIFRAIREGRMAAVSEIVERVLGRKPLRFDDWVARNAAAFQ